MGMDTPPDPAQVAVFEEGWAGDKFYILLHGKLRVFKADVQLALLDAHPADGVSATAQKESYPFFGEMALMDAAPRMASVHTQSPCKILSLSRANFGRFLSLVPDFKDRVVRIKSVRKKESEINVESARDGGVTKDDLAVSAPLDDKLDDVHQIKALQQAHTYPPRAIPYRHSPYPVASPLITACYLRPYRVTVTRYGRRYFPAPSPLPPSPPRPQPPPHPHPTLTLIFAPTLTLALAPTSTLTVTRCA